MSLEKRKYAVNWQDGMKVRTDHFIALEDWVSYSIKDASVIGNYSFGLVPPLESSLKLLCNPLPDNEIEVILLACRAVTAGGIRIDRREDENEIPGIKKIGSKYKIDSVAKERLDVILAADPYARETIYNPDPEESPPRRPFVSSKYSLKIIPSGNPYNSYLELKIGEIIYEGETPAISKEYIPPCTRVVSYLTLYDNYLYFEKILNEIHINSVKVFRELRSDSLPEGMDSLVRKDLRFFSQELTFFLGNTLSWYHTVLPQSSPLLWIEYFVRLARVIDTLFKSLEPEAKESLATCFREYGSILFIISDFDGVLNQIISSEYNHVNIQTSIRIIEKMLDLLANTFKGLSNRKFRKIYTGMLQGAKEVNQ